MNARTDFGPGLDDTPPSLLRIPPHSIDAEAGLLGGLLMDMRPFDGVSLIVQPGDFFRHEHRLVFGAICSLGMACKPVDVVTVAEHLQRTGGSDVGLAYLNTLAQSASTPAAMVRYAEIVAERAMLRRLISVTDEAATSAFNPGEKTAAEVVDEAQRLVMAITEDRTAKRDDWQSTDEAVVQLLDSMQEPDADPAVPTGLPALDEILNGGTRPGHLMVVGGRPSMGKTALAMSIGMHQALNEGVPVAMLSMEMPRRELAQRQMSLVSGIHLSRIQRPERLRDATVADPDGDWARLTEAVEMLRSTPFHVSDQSGLTILQAAAKLRGLKRRVGIRTAIVDYLGLMRGTDPKKPRVYQLEEITQGFKALAKELDITVILLAQVKRLEGPDSLPSMDDLRDSGAIEQDADEIVFVHRPIKANPELSEEWNNYAKVRVAKQRNGPVGDIDLMYLGRNTKFMAWPDSMPVPVKPAKSGSGSRL